MSMLQIKMLSTSAHIFREIAHIFRKIAHKVKLPLVG